MTPRMALRHAGGVCSRPVEKRLTVIDCAAKGWKASTVCVRALNDSKFVQRHQRRLKQMAKDETRLRKYMAANPAPEAAEPAQ